MEQQETIRYPPQDQNQQQYQHFQIPIDQQKYNFKMPSDIFGSLPQQQQLNQSGDINGIKNPQQPQDLNKQQQLYPPQQFIYNSQQQPQQQQQQQNSNFDQNNNQQQKQQQNQQQNSDQNGKYYQRVFDIPIEDSSNESNQEESNNNENNNEKDKRKKKQQSQQQSNTQQQQPQNSSSNNQQQQPQQQQNQSQQQQPQQFQNIIPQQNYNHLNFSSNFNTNKQSSGTNIFGNQILHSNGISNSFNNYNLQYQLLNPAPNQLESSLNQFNNSIFPPQQQFQQQQDQLFMLESSNMQKKQGMVPFHQNFQQQQQQSQQKQQQGQNNNSNTPNNTNLNLSKITEQHYNESQPNLQSSLFDSNMHQNLQNYSTQQNTAIGQQQQQNQGQNNNINNGQRQNSTSTNTTWLPQQQQQDNISSVQSHNNNNQDQQGKMKKKGKKKQNGKQSQQQQQQNSSVNQSAQSLESEQENQFQDLSLRETDMKELLDKYQEIQQNILGKQNQIKEKQNKIQEIYNDISYVSIEWQKLSLDFNTKQQQLQQLIQLLQGELNFSNPGISFNMQQKRKNKILQIIQKYQQQSQSIENVLLASNNLYTQQDHNQRLYQQHIQNHNSFLQQIKQKQQQANFQQQQQQQQQQNHQQPQQFNNNFSFFQQQQNQDIQHHHQQRPELPVKNIKEEDNNSIQVPQQINNTKQEPITIQEFEKSLKQHQQPKRQYNKKNKSQPNTKHVAVNMMNNLLKYIEDIYHAKIPCYCLQMQQNSQKKQHEKDDEEQDQQVCKRCEDLKIIQDYHKLKTVNLESFRNLWENFRIREISENYFLYRGSSHILGKNYTQNNKEALHSCLRGYFIGVRDFKHFYKQL